MAKEKIGSGGIVAEVPLSEGEMVMATKEKVVTEFPDIDEQGFQKVMSPEGEVVYAKEVPCGCEKRIIIVKKDGTVVTDTTEFKQGAYIRAWTCNGAPFRHELMGGN